MPLDLHQLLPQVPTFVLVFFRLAGMMLFAPLFGSSRIPRRVKVLLAAVLALGITGGIEQPVAMPQSTWLLAAAIGGEMAFGLAMGMVLSLVFIAAQWAGELIGQQMGLGLGEVFDPQFGSSGSVLGEMYFMLTLVVFLAVGGHRAMLEGVRASFDSLPLLSAGISPSLFDTLTGLLGAATQLALRLAAPMLVTTLVVDLVLGLIGKTMPQMNVMAAGLTIRSVVGMVIVIAGISLTSRVIREEVRTSMANVYEGWVQGPAERVQGSAERVQGSAERVQGSGFGVQ
jgi:flagellar biosynthetic protein FliR